MAPAQSGVSRFYLGLGAAAVVGAGLIGWQVMKPKPLSIPANPVILPADTAGFRGYRDGADSAPVEVTEYADFECPACQDFMTVQMPTIEERLIRTGKVRWRYRDFPLDNLHPHTRVAAHAAACGDEQGKYWDMNRAIYSWTPNWTVKRDAAPVFRELARQNGLDLARYDACMASGKFAGRIQASQQEGVAVGVNSTPTFLIAGRLYAHKLAYDELKAIIDSLSGARSAGH